MSYSLSIITAARDINMGCWIHRYVFPRNSNLCVNSLILLFKVCIIASSYLLSRFWYCCDYLLKRLPGQTGQPVMKQFQANPVLWSMSGCLRNSLARFWIISGTLIKCVCVWSFIFYFSTNTRVRSLLCCLADWVWWQIGLLCRSLRGRFRNSWVEGSDWVTDSKKGGKNVLLQLLSHISPWEFTF